MPARNKTPEPEISTYSAIGKSIPRVEGIGKVQGLTAYVADQQMPMIGIWF